MFLHVKMDCGREGAVSEMETSSPDPNAYRNFALQHFITSLSSPSSVFTWDTMIIVLLLVPPTKYYH